MLALKKKKLAAVLATLMGSVSAAGTASADVIQFGYDAWFTMVNTDGTEALVNGDAADKGAYGRRTPINGTLSFDTDTGAGTGYSEPFSFFGSGQAWFSNITFQTIGDGVGGQGPLILGNMAFNWKGPAPVSIVLDGSGLFSAIQGGLTTGDVIAGVGALPATDDFLFTFGKYYYTLPVGPTPIASTTFNTTDIGTVSFDSNPSGTLPLTDDGIGGSPMKAGPFPGFNMNLDFASLEVLPHVDPIPVPAAVWLFGSGLAGLIAVARRRRTA